MVCGRRMSGCGGRTSRRLAVRLGGRARSSGSQPISSPCRGSLRRKHYGREYSRRWSAVKFLYKIYSGYDGFQPARIDGRMIDGKTLRLGWDKYLDVVEPGAEVWVYFR